MDAIKKIAYNCRKATELIEKKELARLTIREKFELRLHLSGCSVCRTYQQQSLLINRRLRQLFSASVEKNNPLDENFKKILQEKIEKELEKS